MLAEKKHSDNGNEDEYLHHARIASTGKPSHPIRAGSYPKLTVHCHLGVTHQMHSFETTELNSWKNKRGAHRWGATGHTMQGRLSFWLLALFSFPKILQNFLDSPSHRIFRRMHEVLNIDENKN